MNRQTAGQPLRNVPILSKPPQDRQPVPAGQRHFSAFEAAPTDTVEDQTRAGGTELARSQRCIGALQSAAIGHDHPQEPVGRGRELTLQLPRAMSEIDDDCLMLRTGGTHPLEPVERICCALTNFGKPQVLVELNRRLIGWISIDSISGADVEQRGQASTLGISVEHKR